MNTKFRYMISTLFRMISDENTKMLMKHGEHPNFCLDHVGTCFEISGPHTTSNTPNTSDAWFLVQKKSGKITLALDY